MKVQTPHHIVPFECTVAISPIFNAISRKARFCDFYFPFYKVNRKEQQNPDSLSHYNVYPQIFLTILLILKGAPTAVFSSFLSTKALDKRANENYREEKAYGRNKAQNFGRRVINGP